MIRVEATDEIEFALRRSTAPYRTLGLIFFAILLWGFIMSYRSGKWGTFESAVFVFGFYFLYVLVGLWYRVGLRDGVIWERAFGLRRISIKIEDITAVGREISDAKTLVAMNRPYDRIAVQGIVKGQKTTIDVSTKHFVAADIRQLMRFLQKQRPDLALPKNWL